MARRFKSFEVYPPEYCEEVLATLRTPVHRSLTHRTDLQPITSFLNAVSNHCTSPTVYEVQKSLIAWGFEV